MKRKLIITVTILFLAFVSVFTGSSCFVSADINANQVKDFRITNQDKDIVQDNSVHPEDSLVKTIHDLKELRHMCITLKDISDQPKISKKEVIEIASQILPATAEHATSIIAEYHAITKPKAGLFSNSAKEKNPKLMKDDFLNDTPVYIVSFKGLSLPNKGYSGGPPTTEINRVIDANSGEDLFGFDYR